MQIPGRFSPFLVVGGGAIAVNSPARVVGDDRDFQFHWGLGAKYYFDEDYGIRFDARQLHMPSNRRNNEGTSVQHELLVGFSYAIGRNSAGPRDRDGDGITDGVDKCPDEAAKTSDGCPVRDADGDGVPDDADKCPDIKGTESDGCPGDRDGDGVRDDKDTCPDEAGTLANGCPDPDPDRDGVKGEFDKCPTVASSEPDGCPANDRDKDGIVDDEDKCPDTVGVAPDGCPPDSDGDGIIDANDKCVNEAETPNGYQDADGCPDEVPEAVKKFTGTIKGINFKTGSASIASSSFPILDNAVKVLKEYPDLKMEIDGHTDSAGSARGNKRLSQRRADAVKAYFVKNGIAAERLKAVGYGEEKPIEPNRTAEGRAANRRIEFKLIN